MQILARGDYQSALCTFEVAQTALPPGVGRHWVEHCAKKQVLMQQGAKQPTGSDASTVSVCGELTARLQQSLDAAGVAAASQWQEMRDNVKFMFRIPISHSMHSSVPSSRI